jgi:hypothetical protein
LADHKSYSHFNPLLPLWLAENEENHKEEGTLGEAIQSASK